MENIISKKVFKSIEEIEEYVEWECSIIAHDIDGCYMCGKTFTPSKFGIIDYHLCDEYAPDEKFCSANCIQEYLIDKYLVEEDEESK